MAAVNFSSRLASSGEEAIGLLSTNKYRVMIIDISLGSDHVKGWPVARRARAINPDLPVIYITGGNTANGPYKVFQTAFC